MLILLCTPSYNSRFHNIKYVLYSFLAESFEVKLLPWDYVSVLWNTSNKLLEVE